MNEERLRKNLTAYAATNARISPVTDETDLEQWIYGTLGQLATTGKMSKVAMRAAAGARTSERREVD